MNNNFTPAQNTLAWLVHFFTATGMVAGFMSLLAIADHNWRMAMFWLLVSQVIDALDGTFARWFRVKEVLPFFDGKMLDSVIDFANYAIIPAYFLYEAGMVSAPMSLPVAAAVLLTSGMYYGKSGMVSSDYHFVGFPVMWNFVIFYLFFVFNLGHTGNLLLFSAFCILHFVPVKYIYPTRTEEFWLLNTGITVFTIVACALLVYLYPKQTATVTLLKVMAVAGLLYFGFMSVYKTYFYKA
ncbi:hypothetical protein C7N43_19175 [Sphingobacteriales bacterium UPWRP_1]|nr:hypothetical protein C7N43_19175 [Sphingobacteriales bacterium UPWRP_1]